MLPPYELEDKVFKRVMKGYNTVEVDEHIAFIVEKYKELYRAYNNLEKKYTGAVAELATYKENEEAIRQTLETSQSTGEQLVYRAKERSEIILRAAREECDEILASFKKDIADQAALLAKMRADVADFKASIFAQYQQHIEYLESIAPDVHEQDIDDVSAETISKTVSGIVNRANSAISEHSMENIIYRSQTENVGSIEIGADALKKNSGVGIGTSDRRAADEYDPADPDDLTDVADIGELDEVSQSKPSGSGDTMKFHVIPDIPQGMSDDEDIIFG